MRGGNCGISFYGQPKPPLLQLEAVYVVFAKLKCYRLALKHTAWHRIILPSYVYRLLTLWGTAICTIPLEDY